MSEIIYFIDNKLGGVSSLNYNLINNSPIDINQTVILLDEVDSVMTRSKINYPVQKQIEFKYSYIDNIYSVLNKLRNKLPDSEGALILNYGTEMSMLDNFPVKQTTYQLVHDSYNLSLSEKYGHLVDIFICHNRYIESELLKLFPLRKLDIFYLPHGVSIPDIFRKNVNTDAPLKLLFLGRMYKSKGIFDLPVISKILSNKNIDVEWTCIGSGPDFNEFKSVWSDSDHVTFLSLETYDEVIKVAASHDLFVLPSKFEGTPVSLLETMSVGLVPIITLLPGGIEEIVTNDIGFALPKDDNNSFAEAISELHFNRTKLNMLSINCRQKIIDDFDIRNTSKKYFNLFMRYSSFNKIKNLLRKRVGSRLDHPFIPNFITRIIRGFLKG